MAAQKSYKEVFVVTNPTLLADGSTVETIAAGQLGILDAKTHLSETTPTYATQKAIKLVLGTPNVATLTTSGVPNENIYTKLIKGKKIRDFKGFAADTTGTKESWAIGNIGSGTLDLVANKGQVKHVFVKLTGGPIDKAFGLNGITKMFSVVDGLVGQAGLADSNVLADQLVAAINADKDIATWTTASKITTGSYRGVKILVDNVDRVTDEATRQYFPRFEQEAVHVQISEFDPNYNNDIEAAVSYWPVTKLTSFSTTRGAGAFVQAMEEDALAYHLKHRSFDPVVRANEGYKLNADATKFYDEYVLTFDFSYKTGGYTEETTDCYKLHVFFEVGTGDAFEAAINGYIDTIGLSIDPVTIA